MLRAQSGRTNYFLGDTELGVRFQLARGPDAWSSGPVDSTFARGFRATVGGRVRIPTGSREAVLFPLQFAPEGGHWGFGGDAAADWFLSRRWWVTAAADAQVLFPTDVQRLAFAADVPFPDTTQVRTLRREAGARFGASVTPRYRLTREISFAGQYAFRHAGAVTLSADEPAVLLGPIETLDARTAHALGLGMSYSTLAAYRAGESPFPAEFSLLYRRVVTGSGFQPAASSVELTARLFTRIFGGAARVPAPPPAPAAPAAATDTIPPTGESE